MRGVALACDTCLGRTAGVLAFPRSGRFAEQKAQDRTGGRPKNEEEVTGRLESARVCYVDVGGGGVGGVGGVAADGAAVVAAGPPGRGAV